MKNKPQKHKDSNAFKFKSFADRISTIDIRQNALYHIHHFNEEINLDENGTHFHETYLKWQTLNLSEEYNGFQKQIHKIITLPQLLHKKDFVVEHLLKSLQNATTLSLQPLLEFVVILAKDLREEFYSYFPRFLECLIKRLESKDADQLEWTLICLAYLFKTLKSFLKKDITIVFNAVLPLLSNRNPEHIVNFAAECFSFIARDIKDKERFLQLVLTGLKHHKNGVQGCGRVFFEIIKGMNGQFHNCAETFLNLLLSNLSNTKYDCETLFEVCTNFNLNILQNIHPKNMNVFWNVCLKQQEENRKNSMENDDAIRKILILMGQAIEYRHGKYLPEVSPVIELLIILADAEISEKSLLTVSQVVVAILLSSNLNITQLDASRLSKKITNSTMTSRDVFQSFIWNIVSYSQFELLILPEFLNYFDCYCSEDGGPLNLLAKIVLKKSPLQKASVNLSEWKRYPLKIKSNGIKFIEDRILNGSTLSIQSYILEVIIYPHLMGTTQSSAHIIDRLERLIEELCEYFDFDEDESITDADQIALSANRKFIFTLATVIETLIHLGEYNRINLHKIIDTFLPCIQHPEYSAIFGIIDQILSIQNEDTLNRELFEKIHGKLSKNLSSPDSNARLHTINIFKHFAKNSSLTIAGGLDIYEIFFQIESIQSSVHTYRDQLLHLQKLSAELPLYEGIRNEIHRYDPLRYLFGVMYTNFSLLWKPVSNLISSYSNHLPTDEFWTIFKAKLNETTNEIRNPSHKEDDDDDDSKLQSYKTSFANDVINKEFDQFWTTNSRIDLLNYRILLWRVIPECGNLNEIKNRDIVTLFLDFIKIEYHGSNEGGIKTWNVLKENDDKKEETTKDASDDLLELDEKPTETYKATQRTLIPMMNVFTSLANPKQIHRQSELYDLFLEFLYHRNGHIQKLSLDCIMAYKHKFLMPYKDQLYGLIDETKFKDTITSFAMDGENTVVQQEHRADLMVILIRILYGKLIARGQKGSGNLKKNLTMRFLGGLQEDEIFLLLNMAFGIYQDLLLQDNMQEMCANVLKNVNLEAIISPKKLQSSLNLVEIMREQFAGLMGPKFLQHLLKIVCLIGSQVLAVLNENDRINKIHLKLFKSLRNECQQSLGNFFNHFDTYRWTSAEIETIFNIFIDPFLSKLPSDSLQSPTPLLKLFSIFGKNPRYFILFTKLPNEHNPTEDDVTPLRFIMELLADAKAKPRVCLMIMEIVQNLLLLSKQQTDESTTTALEIIPFKYRSPATQLTNEINLGSSILLPYIPRVLEKLQQNVKRRRGLTKRDLLILSRSTELVTDVQTCRSLLTLILPIMVRKSQSAAGEEALVQMIQTVSNLFQRIDYPEDFIRDITPMFQQITLCGPRKLLCDLLYGIAKRSTTEHQTELKEMADLVQELNAWDRRWVEQPDYERRLEAYKKIGTLEEMGKLNLNTGLLVIYHSFYFIKHDKDMAMRDSASYHLKKIVPSLVRALEKNPADIEYLIGNVVLNLCRKSLQDNNENIRGEGILLLGELVRECPNAHPVLQDLNQLTNKDDREVDFFDNITHLQHHRHIKALMRFCSVAKTLDRAPMPRTLTQFILPLASQFLCTEKHASKHGLVTAAIEAIGAACRLLPWHQYEAILKYYLKKLRFNVEHQKQIVRLVMQILDSFHFDLSKAKLAPKQMAENFLKAKQLDDEEPKKTEENDTKLKSQEDDDNEEEIVLKADDLAEEEEEDQNFDQSIVEDTKEEEDDTEPIPTVKKQKVCIYEHITVLSHSVAKRLVHTIATGLIPALNNTITTISAYDNFHKINKKKRKSEREEEEILRVPIALAMIKLLQKLPEGMLDHSLPGIFIKICMFLKSPLRSVRMVARDVLRNIILTIGPNYLDILLNQLTTLLTRGFQVHVLTVTVHSILDAIKTKLKPGIIDKCLQCILNVCLEDIFGKTAEEKEILKIGSATPEAKPSNKSYLTLQIVAVNITESCILDLLVPFKEQLVKYQSKSVVMKIQECFQKIIMGFMINKNITIEWLLSLIYGLSAESIPALLPKIQRPVLSEREKDKIIRERPDCYLIQEEPKRVVKAKTIKNNIKANAHVLVEFGLELLHVLLKRGKLLKISYQQYLDPIIPYLLESLKSTEIRVTTFALKCLASIWNREMESKRLTKIIEDIVPEIFAILHKYATAGMSTSNENFNLVKNAFKAMVSLLRYAKYFRISEEQLKTLLLYVEQNLHDANTQTIAFSLLKVIIERKLQTSEMHECMKKVCELAIVSENSAARQDAKATIGNYLMDYPLGKKIDGSIKFFVSNLNYEVISGRESVISILLTIIKRFPKDDLNKKAGYLFLSLGAQLINDESTDCRKQIANCIETLLVKIDLEKRNELFEIVVALMDDKKLSHREMAAILCSRFVDAEKNEFANRIETILPVLIRSIALQDSKAPGQYVRVKTSTDMENDDNLDAETMEQKQRAKDHQLIQSTNTIIKILNGYQGKLNDLSHYVDELAYECQKLLSNEHTWIRFNAAKMLGIILKRIDVVLLNEIIQGNVDCEPTSDFIYSNPAADIKSLTLDLCAQMIPEETDSDIANEVVKNLLCVANIIKDIPWIKSNEEEEDEESIAKVKVINLPWLIRRMRYVVHAEVAKAPQSTILRTAVFRWIEGLVELIDDATVRSISQWLLAPLVREMSDDDRNIDAKLKRYAIKVGDKIKEKLNEDDYNLLRAQLQKKLMLKRAERKKQIAQTKVIDPVRAALRKEGEQKRKRWAKKRKIDEIKGRTAPKKRKTKKLDDDLF